MMLMGRLAVFIALCALNEYVSGVIIEYVPDHTDAPSISLDYDTVTEIIEALNSEEDSGISLKEDFDDDFQGYPGNDIVYDYVYENHPEDLFERRIGGHSQRRRKYKKQRSHKMHYSPERTEEPEVVESYPEPEPVPEEPEPPCEVPSEEVPNEEETIEYTSAEDSYGYVGSLKGRPGIDYPNYKEIPLTSFTCADKEYIPGFYADVETRCQVFHVCYPHRRESFLCPVGTVFNQPIKACDYWYNGNCSSSSKHYDVNEVEEPFVEEEPTEHEITEEDIKSVIDELFPETELPCEEEPIIEPEEIKPVEVTTPVYVEPEVKPKPVIIVVPEIPQKPIVPKPIAPSPVEVPSVVKFIPVKAKVTKFVVPIAGKAKAKSIFSSAIKSKAVHVKAPIKMAKVKVAVAPLKAIPVAKLLKTVPVLKKAVAHKAFVKTKVAASVVKPVLFKKAAAANSLLLKKAKLAKAKKIIAAKAAVPVVSALTKKHLALSLVKMLKAHKLRGGHGYPFRYGYYKY